MTWKATWTGSKDQLEAIDLYLTEIIDPPVDATSLVRDDDGSSEPEDAPWLLHAYTEHKLSGHIVASLPTDTQDPQHEELPDRDWVADSLEGLGIVRAGPFILYGRHDAEDAALLVGIKLQIEANQAFGTGHHPTTRGCLEALGELEGLDPKAVLDIGTGSGVLAFGARRLYPGAVVIATDVDHRSIEIARENAEINDISDIELGVATGTDYNATQSARPFDLIFANILAGPLKELAPDIEACCKPGTIIVLAGLLDEQMTDVLVAYKAQGFELTRTGGTSRWPVLTLTKKNSAL